MNFEVPRWFSAYQEDVSAKLPTVRIPALLLWGDSDPVSPVCVGERLAWLLPLARLHIVEGGDHDPAETHAAEVAPLIDEFLATEAQSAYLPWRAIAGCERETSGVR